MIKAFIPWLEQGEYPVIVGSSDRLGLWNPECGIPMKKKNAFFFKSDLTIDDSEEWKIILLDLNGNIFWESGGNRVGHSKSTIWFRGGRKATGVAVPLFSLRSESDNGIGDFQSLKLFVQKVGSEGHKVVQLLPINDTCRTHTAKDSYPYNIISTCAINPIYLSLDEMGTLEDVELAHSIADRTATIYDSPRVEWDDVISIKWDFFKAIYKQDGERTLKNKDFLEFVKAEKGWLIPYAIYCYLRDLTGTTDFSKWGKYSTYTKTIEKDLMKEGSDSRKDVYLHIFLQYHADLQLKNVRKTATSCGVLLKGDIPIGVAADSVEVWHTPNYFYREFSTGAPPDAFAESGQNWGFPTYNWKNIKKDKYQWWKLRLKKMSQYFDLYRIDHVLGLFRIWEIPEECMSGLKGHFSPCLAYTINEIQDMGFDFVPHRDVAPYLTESYVKEKLGEDFQRHGEFFRKTLEGLYRFKPNMNSDSVLIDYFKDRKEDEKPLRDKLLKLHDECLFVKVYDKYQPRIAGQFTNGYLCLSDKQKDAYNKLYDEFYYSRNEDFWQHNGEEKLEVIVNETDMLCCAEDLGMIPACVPNVLKKLGIMSLEVERMPKDYGRIFADVYNYPYMSVATTSTHDMSPIKEWWLEDRNQTQNYWNNVMHWDGEASFDANHYVCQEIVNRHRNSSSSLVILPFQDWHSVEEDYPYAVDYGDNVLSDRINVPSNPNQCWNWRIHMKYKL